MNIDTTECPQLINKYRTPKILWFQTDIAIFFRISLMNIDKYFMKVESNTFRFTTSVDDAEYFLGINLFGTVIAEKTTHMKLGREMKVCLIKAHKWTDWPRLQLNKIRNPLIIIDPDHIVKKSWDNPYASLSEKENFHEYKKRINIRNIGPPLSSTSGSESDDENIMGYD